LLQFSVESRLMPYLFTEQGDKFTEEEREKMKKKGWDTNAITPGKSITSQRHGDHSLINTFHTGTPFMDLLAASLRYWVSWKLNNDPGWKNVSRIRLFTTNMPSSRAFPQTAQNYHFRRFSSRRRRAQDYGLDSSREELPRVRPEYQPRHLRPRKSQGN
jgi:hypothetical protein